MSRKCGDKWFTIYHIKGEKVGCTANVTQRKALYRSARGKCPPMYLIERIPRAKGVKYAGDREWHWADHFGYPRGQHYAVMVDIIRNRRYLKGRATHMLDKLTFEQRSRTSRRLIRENIAGFAAAGDVRCPHCGLVGNTGIMHAWHFDRCLVNPSLTMANRKARRKMSVSKDTRCPHCKKTGQLPAMKRWHFENCKIMKGKRK